MSTENLTLLKELAQDQRALEREDGEHEDHELEDLLASAVMNDEN